METSLPVVGDDRTPGPVRGLGRNRGGLERDDRQCSTSAGGGSSRGPVVLVPNSTVYAVDDDRCDYDAFRYGVFWYVSRVTTGIARAAGADRTPPSRRATCRAPSTRCRPVTGDTITRVRAASLTATIAIAIATRIAAGIATTTAGVTTAPATTATGPTTRGATTVVTATWPIAAIAAKNRGRRKGPGGGPRRQRQSWQRTRTQQQVVRWIQVETGDPSDRIARSHCSSR